MYVLFHATRYQDGTEEGAKLFASLDDAIETATRWKYDDPNPHNVTVRLFKVGDEIKLGEETEEVPQPSVKKTRIVVAK